MSNHSVTDRNNFDLVEMANIPRLFAAVPRGTKPFFTELTGYLTPILSKLSVRHPEWVPVLSLYNVSADFEIKPLNTSGLVSMTHVFTKDLDQHLGTLDYSGGFYEISNTRIRSERKRGSAVRTKDMTKALRTIDKHFYAATDEEYFWMVNDKSMTRASMDVRIANGALAKVRDMLGRRDVMESAIIPLLDQICERMSDAAARDALASLPTRLADLRKAEQHMAFLRTGSPTVVAVRDDMCRTAVVTDWQNPPKLSREQPTSELSPFLRTRLGMLKLSEPNKVIYDVGMRLDDVTFIIFKTE